MMNLLQTQPDSAQLNTGRTSYLGASKQERRDLVIMEPRCTDRGGETVLNFLQHLPDYAGDGHQRRKV